jgi:hypothetical protein
MKGRVRLKNMKSTAGIAAECEVEEGVVWCVSSDLKLLWEDGKEYWTPAEAAVIEERVWLYLLKTDDSRKKIKGMKALAAECMSRKAIRVCG